MKGDRIGQEKAYRRPLELHYSSVDPLVDGCIWECLEGLGEALLLQRKLAAAVLTLERAVAFAKEEGLDPEETSVSPYNIACGYALLKQYPKAFEALKDAITANL